MIVNFRDEAGNTISIRAKSFLRAYLEACSKGFEVFDFDIEEEGI